MMVFEVLSRAYSAFDGLSPLFPPVFTPVRTAVGRRACKKDGRNGWGRMKNYFNDHLGKEGKACKSYLIKPENSL